MATEAWTTNRIHAAEVRLSNQIAAATNAIPAPDYSTGNAALVATIEATAPAPDFSTNNAALVSTIEAKAPAPGNYAAVSNRAMQAVTNLAPAYAYADERFIPISGSLPVVTDVSLYFNQEIYEQGMLRLTLPNGENRFAVDFVSSPQITNEGAVAAAQAYTDAAVAVPAPISAQNTVPWHGGLVELTVASGATLAVNSAGWPNGGQVLVDATLPATYTVANGISPVGYSTLPSDGEYLMVITRLGSSYFVSLISTVEAN